MKFILLIFTLISCKSFLSTSLIGKQPINATPPVVAATTTTTTTTPRRPTGECEPIDRHLGDAVAGSRLYFDNNCVSCHDTDGSGAIYGSIIGASDEEIFEAIKINPPKEMEALKNLDSCVIQDIAAHIDSF